MSPVTKHFQFGSNEKLSESRAKMATSKLGYKTRRLTKRKSITLNNYMSLHNTTQLDQNQQQSRQPYYTSTKNSPRQLSFSFEESKEEKDSAKNK